MLAIPKYTKMIVAAIFVALILLASSCNTPTKAVDNAGLEGQQTTNAAAIPSGEQAGDGVTVETDTATSKSNASKSSQKNGNIRVIVNGQVITNYDIQRRVAFLKLRRASGNLAEKATDELVEEAIKMQEARRRKTRAGDAEVRDAFANFAKGNKMTSTQLSQVLGRSGVSEQHFKEFIRGQISWSRTVGAKFQSETRRKSTEETLFEIRKSGGVKPETNEYLLQQVIFVIPDNKRKAILKQRLSEADAFRQQFQSCDTTAKLAVGQSDVTVRELPRILEPQLPEEWVEQITKTPVNGTTTTLETDKGVEFLAVCSRKTVSDDSAAAIVTQSKEFENFSEKGSQVAESFLKELKAKSQIVYH